MSTRRARIKAVAALPQRRKNVDTAATKVKGEQNKEVTKNLIKSPKPSSTAAEKAGHSPAGSGLVVQSPRLLSPRKSPRAPSTPDIEKTSLNLKVPTPSASTEKSNATAAKDTMAHSDVFVSPPARASPLRRRSPVVRTPVADVEVSGERIITPHKRLIELLEQKQAKIPEPRGNILLSPKSRIAASHNAKNNVLDGYNSPNTPENDVMDGIVPLKPVSNAPKPIELLKNEIISENAEVVFDPIVPLPSPTKVRPKLRPVPRLGPMRRNSVPGSASESEDESRRAAHGASTPVPARQRHDSHTTVLSHPNRDVNRVRNDSMCSSQMAPQTPAPASPMREKEKVTKSRRIDVSRRMAAMRRRKESVQRDKMTMFDLIFYNPLTNPIVPDQDELKAKEATKKVEEQRKLESNKKKEVAEESNDATEDSAPVPQIKLGPNGEIILDEQSLVIKQSEQRQLSDSIVHEGAWVSSTSKVYRRTPRTSEWSDAETVRFYRALAALGTDFTLMVTLFPGRSRKDLKLKFKKEEKTNLGQIDKALRSVSVLGADRLEQEFAEERRLAIEREQKLKERLQEEKKAQKEQEKALREMRTKRSKSQSAKLLGMSVMPDPLVNAKECVTANELIDRMIGSKEQKKGRKPKKKSVLPLTPSLQSQFATLTPFAQRSKQRETPRPDNLATIQKLPTNNQFTPPIPQKSPLVHAPLTRPPISPLVHAPLTRPPISPLVHAPLTRPPISPLVHALPARPPKSPLVHEPPTCPQKSPLVNAPPTCPQKSSLVHALPTIPSDIVPGSLVVLTVDDPKAPSQKAVHTYIKQADGSIASVILDPNVMSSIVSYVKQNTPRAGSTSSMSPSSVISERSRTNTPVSASPNKRQRLSSYSITDL